MKSRILVLLFVLGCDSGAETLATVLSHGEAKCDSGGKLRLSESYMGFSYTTCDVGSDEWLCMSRSVHKGCYRLVPVTP